MFTMEECYSLLGISPTAGTDEIEEAYQKKRKEWEPSRFQPGSPEQVNASAMQKRLDQAYNEAVMATFAPIRAFAAPGGANVASPRRAEPAAPPPSSVFSAPVPPLLPKTLPPPVSPSAPASVPPSGAFSDEALRSLDVGNLTGRYEKESEYELEAGNFEFLTLGIEDRLLRFYARTYLAFLLIDLALLFAWGGELHDAPLPLSVLASFVSRASLMLCSLPMPVIARFIVYGEPPENVRLVLLTFGSCAVALVPYLLSWFLIGCLVIPENQKIWAGTITSLFSISLVICMGTLRYQNED